MRFYSKKGLFLGIIIWGTMAFMVCSFLFQYSGQKGVAGYIVGILINGVLLAFFSWLWFGTHYEIGEEFLKIVSGPIRMKVEIQKITSVKRTRNPLSSPALSTDRLEIKYGKWDFVLNSPKNEERFCEILLEKNPQIMIHLDKK
jgi:hypothetical protein